MARVWPLGAIVLIDDGVLKMFVQSSYSAAAAAPRHTGNARRGGYQGHARAAVAWRCRWRPAHGRRREMIAGVTDGVLIRQVQGLHSGVNTVSRATSPPARPGLLITERSTRCAGA